MNKLTELEVKAHVKAVRAWREAGVEKPPEGKSWKLFDGGGLFLTVTAAGTPVWRVKYAFGGKTGRYFAAGTYPEVSLQAARLARARVKADLEKGKDPVQARRMSRVAAVVSAGTTFESVAEAWLAKSRSGWSQAHYETTAETLERYAKPLRSFPIAEITDPMVGKLVEHVVVERESIDTARKLRQSLAGIFRYAMARGFCTHNPAESSRELIPRKRQIGRRPALLEFAALGDILRRASAANLSRAVHMAHRLCAFSAARVGNVISAEWSEFAELDAEVPAWVIPRAKMKAQDRHHDHRVILGPPIADELRAWRRMTGSGRYLFPSLTDPSEHIVSEALSKLYRVTLGLKKTHTPHGYRAAFATLARENGFDRDAVEMALDHVHASEVVRAYDRGARLPERVRLANWWCEQLVRAERGDE
ncbi:tyrosine-type recombinase/integrase [Archangium lansingense]|uniref:Integrase arm-type DNA-binding domain-containing protein n=1 Tax=Archangium lansingense TaxID=2995310 RepID=A0ABT4ABB7_9BACT|nr:integrase arm-type DNA-binding domain-containing protein [Archangium lansinium]MCY1078866.1 integrase arm-type DNA-binding domain-containing protein [Archangium lansinium]